jgi:t-SNARE complex subunit (syntaxin)
MNKQRRRRIEDIVSQLMDLQSEIEEIRDEEQEIVDNTPDSLQGTERFEIAEAAADNLDNACLDMESLIDYLNQSAE